MSAKSKIEWTDRTWNPTIGCTRVSEGCRHCYAETMAARVANAAQERARRGEELTPVQRAYQNVVMWERGKRGGPADDTDKAMPKWSGNVELLEERLTDPLRWSKPGRIFVDSMTDLFHDSIPFEFIDKVFAIMALCPQHTFQILTKRPERMAEYLIGAERSHKFSCEICNRLEAEDRNPLHWNSYAKWPLPNVWLGTSVEDQDTADERIPHLLRCHAAVRFLSCEPLLGNVDVQRFLKRTTKHHMSVSIEGALRNRSFDGFTDDNGKLMPRQVVEAELYRLHSEGKKLLPMANCPDFDDQTGCPGHTLPRVDWVICGAESGPNARPMHPDWPRSIRDQCVAAGVPFFFKQWGEWFPMGQTLTDGSISCLDRHEAPGLWDAATLSARLGKGRTGRFLDGRTWDEFPEGAQS
ncbi:MAG: phage Gp37/Gp68 family protein [Armatimonadetes bacterium]|nr:phage Gp37/Gp68 family protein [Armatimonadota bacterium]